MIVDAGGVSVVPADGATRSEGGGLPVLIYTNATAPFHIHDSIPAAAMAIQQSLTAVGTGSEISADPAKFTTLGLAPYGAIVLVETAGYPFGMPGTAEIDALVSYVRNGRGLVGVHNSTHAYPDSTKVGALQGAEFVGHDDVEWSDPVFVNDHLRAGILWTLGVGN